MVRTKKAVIGIGTLIVFIAMILVSAVAAGVIIRTSGILQERAFAVGSEARKRLVTGIEVVQVDAIANVSAATVPQMELYVRTRSGSRPVQLQTTGMTFSTSNVAFSANLQHKLTEAFNYEVDFANGTWQSLGFDMNRDQLNEYFRVVNGTGDNAIAQFNISDAVNFLVNVSLGFNYSDGSEMNLSKRDIKINDGGDIYGHITLLGNRTGANYINGSAMTNFSIHQFPSDNVCEYFDLIPERFFCYKSMVGDTDTILESGEMYVLKYQVKQENALNEEQGFQVNFIPKDGGVTFLQSAPPSVISDYQFVLWPQ